MKAKFPIKFFIAAVAVILGLVGVLVSLVPHYSAPEAAVARYIDAVNSGNAEQLFKATIASDMASAMNELGNQLGIDSSEMGNLMNEMQEGLQNSTGATVTENLGLLKQSFIAVPDGAVGFVKAELLGCVVGEPMMQQGATGHDVTALIKVTYTDAEGEEKTAVCEENVGVANIGKGFKVADF